MATFKIILIENGESFYFSDVVDHSLDEHFLRLQIHEDEYVHNYVFPITNIKYMKMIEDITEVSEDDEERSDDSYVP